ncbi:MAG: XdhC family protein [Hoeflea sp.]|uniref:XdhC family protein n=1 Tax=Hoeflea sp. TaxID=1940281 RepID=UPI003EF22A83
MPRQSDILDLMNDYKSKGEPFALATVVRTVSVTAAKAGAKAVIRGDGTMTEGWIGGGCARSAVLKAAREALADGQSRLVSIQPDEQLSEHQVKPGETREGVVYAKNMCPSQGTMDVFVEPVLPRPHLTICGASPVAVALADLARRMGFFITICAPADDHTGFGETDRLIDGYTIPADGSERDYVVIATQGRGDSAALKAAVKVPSKYLAFVGSRKKAAALKADLAESGVSSTQLENIHAPAGLNLGAITPDEIAFSIVAEMIEIRRRGQRTL